MLPTSIIIIAAGESKRMGEPKQLLKWEDSTLLGHSIEQAIKSKANRTYVALGAYYDEILPTIESYPVSVIRNNDWADGMGSTISFSVKHALKIQQSNLLITLADQPDVTSDYLDAMIDAFESTDKKIVATDYGNSGAGVPAMFGLAYAEKLKSLSGDKGAKKIIQAESDLVLRLTPKTPFIDIDTKQVYLEMIKRH